MECHLCHYPIHKKFAWHFKFLENFSRSGAKTQQKLDKEVDTLRAKLNHKDGIIVELLEEREFTVKKTMGPIDRSLGGEKLARHLFYSKMNDSMFRNAG